MRKNLFVLLIFAVIAGAIAGAFVFLNHLSTTAPASLNGIFNSTGGPNAQQSSLTSDSEDPSRSFNFDAQI
jgi:hypothetical protein